MKKRILILSSICAFTCINNSFGMKNDSNQQPQDMTELLKRNNELLVVSIKQNHLLHKINFQKMHYLSNQITHTNGQKSLDRIQKAYEFEKTLETLYEKHNIHFSNSSSISSSEEIAPFWGYDEDIKAMTKK